MQSSSHSPSIIIENVSKQYRLGSASGMRLLLTIVHRLCGARGYQPAGFWALRNVSFRVHPGEVLGIIGSNGAGKTTILKLLARVSKPTSGNITVAGKVSALIELGAGFHPELTGRENIYLSGAIFGIKRRQIDRLMDDIIDFSELNQFIDTPVKRYSSGMYARLGFSVAVCVNPDILLVDEVLSVGDIGFQQKSLRRMLDFKAQAKAMIFISHNLHAIQQLCTQVVWLDHGQIVAQGAADRVIEQYQRASESHMIMSAISKSVQLSSSADSPARIAHAELIHHSSQRPPTFAVGEAIAVRIAISLVRGIQTFVCAVALYRHDGLKLGETNSSLEGVVLEYLNRVGIVTLTFHHLPLVPGSYYLNIAIGDGNLITYDHKSYAALFNIAGSSLQNALPGPLYLTTTWSYSACPDFPQVITPSEVTH